MKTKRWLNENHVRKTCRLHVGPSKRENVAMMAIVEFAQKKLYFCTAECWLHENQAVVE